jgi:AcrR family transcriptional regulator
MVTMPLRAEPVNTLVYGENMNDRLNKSDWITHGLRTLASGGVGALKVGPMADELKVSRGSFYWHFKDIGDFKQQLLETWQEVATEVVIRDLQAEKTEPNQLKLLLRKALNEKHGLDRAVRMWAATEESAAAVVASVDTRRVKFIAQLLVASGVPKSEALERAKFLYWAYLGRSLATSSLDSIKRSTVDTIATLFER